MASGSVPAFEDECFLISPIGDDDSDARRRADGVREYIVKPAVAELGLSTVRADDIAQPGQITLQVIEHVLEAKGAVADLTDANPNVFYELAIRHTAMLPVVLIAHEDDRTRLPFDIAQMRTIFYDHQDLKSAADCRTKITQQLAEALEKGTVDSPVAASVNLLHLQAGNASEQGIAQLVGSVERIAAQTSDVRDHVSDLRARIDQLEHSSLELPHRLAQTIADLDAGRDAERAAERAAKNAEMEARQRKVIARIEQYWPRATIDFDVARPRLRIAPREQPRGDQIKRITGLAKNLGFEVSILEEGHGVTTP